MKILRRMLVTAWMSYSVTLAASPITYYVDYPLEEGGVTGTLTTDGTLGRLDRTDLRTWNLLFDDGTDQFSQSYSNSSIFDADALVATPTELRMDPTGSSEFFLLGMIEAGHDLPAGWTNLWVRDPREYAGSIGLPDYDPTWESVFQITLAHFGPRDDGMGWPPPGEEFLHEIDIVVPEVPPVFARISTSGTIVLFALGLTGLACIRCPRDPGRKLSLFGR